MYNEESRETELTGGVHREQIVFSQLLFAVEFGQFRTDEVRLGVHQTTESNGSRADATNRNRVSLGAQQSTA